LYQYYYHGVGNVPRWVGIIEAAKDWGCPPWEVAPDIFSKHQWLNRHRWMNDEAARAQKAKDKSKK
jgi:hypothetical protein